MCGFKAVSERQLCLMIKVARVKKSYSTSKSRIIAQMCSGRFRRLGGPGLRGRGGFRNGLPGLWAHGDKAEDKEWILSPSWTASSRTWRSNPWRAIRLSLPSRNLWPLTFPGIFLRDEVVKITPAQKQTHCSGPASRSLSLLLGLQWPCRSLCEVLQGSSHYHPRGHHPG